MNQSAFISPAFWKPFIISFLFCPHFIHSVIQTHKALSAYCGCCCWLFTTRQQLQFFECCSIRHPWSAHTFSYTCIYRQHTHIMITHIFCLSFLIHFALCLFEFVFFHFMLTAEWHQQVSWLGQFGWYNCYYQHHTFRRIPGSHTNLSNLML